MFEIYKPKQGKRTRGATFAGALLLTVLGGKWISDTLKGYGLSPYVWTFAPVVVMLVIAYLIFWAVYRRSKADFLIATEGEMKKVAWSSRREIIGSTKVVVFATFLLAAMLFAVDTVFRSFFKLIGVLKV